MIPGPDLDRVESTHRLTRPQPARRPFLALVLASDVVYYFNYTCGSRQSGLQVAHPVCAKLAPGKVSYKCAKWVTHGLVTSTVLILMSDVVHYFFGSNWQFDAKWATSSSLCIWHGVRATFLPAPTMPNALQKIQPPDKIYSLTCSFICRQSHIHSIPVR